MLLSAFNGTNNQYPNKGICPVKIQKVGMFIFLPVSSPEGHSITIRWLKIFFCPCWPLLHFRCEFKFFLAHKYKQVISGLLFPFNARTDTKSSTSGYGFWAAYFLIFFFGMDSLFDFVKHQLKSALPGPLQNAALCTFTQRASERKTSPSACTSTPWFIARFKRCLLQGYVWATQVKA